MSLELSLFIAICLVVVLCLVLPSDLDGHDR